LIIIYTMVKNFLVTEEGKLEEICYDDPTTAKVIAIGCYLSDTRQILDEINMSEIQDDFKIALDIFDWHSEFVIPIPRLLTKYFDMLDQSMEEVRYWMDFL